MVSHAIGVTPSERTEGLPWNGGWDVRVCRTRIDPYGMVPTHGDPATENVVGEHKAHCVSTDPLHGTRTWDPAMHGLHDVQLYEPKLNVIRFPLASLW